jgi:hypothetical protein
MEVFSFKPLPLYPLGSRPQYRLDSRQGGTQNLSGYYEDQKYLMTLERIDPSFLRFAAYDKVVISIELPWLHHDKLLS